MKPILETRKVGLQHIVQVRKSFLRYEKERKFSNSDSRPHPSRLICSLVRAMGAHSSSDEKDDISPTTILVTSDLECEPYIMGSSVKHRVTDRNDCSPAMGAHSSSDESISMSL